MMEPYPISPLSVFQGDFETSYSESKQDKDGIKSFCFNVGDDFLNEEEILDPHGNILRQEADFGNHKRKFSEFERDGNIQIVLDLFSINTINNLLEIASGRIKIYNNNINTIDSRSCDFQEFLNKLFIQQASFTDKLKKYSLTEDEKECGRKIEVCKKFFGNSSELHSAAQYLDHYLTQQLQRSKEVLDTLDAVSKIVAIQFSSEIGYFNFSFENKENEGCSFENYLNACDIKLINNVDYAGKFNSELLSSSSVNELNNNILIIVKNGLGLYIEDVLKVMRRPPLVADVERKNLNPHYISNLNEEKWKNYGERYCNFLKKYFPFAHESQLDSILRNKNTSKTSDRARPAIGKHIVKNQDFSIAKSLTDLVAEEMANQTTQGCALEISEELAIIVTLQFLMDCGVLDEPYHSQKLSDCYKKILKIANSKPEKIIQGLLDLPWYGLEDENKRKWGPFAQQVLKNVIIGQLGSLSLESAGTKIWCPVSEAAMKRIILNMLNGREVESAKNINRNAEICIRKKKVSPVNSDFIKKYFPFITSSQLKSILNTQKKKHENQKNSNNIGKKILLNEDLSCMNSFVELIGAEIRRMTHTPECLILADELALIVSLQFLADNEILEKLICTTKNCLDLFLNLYTPDIELRISDLPWNTLDDEKKRIWGPLAQDALRNALARVLNEKAKKINENNYSKRSPESAKKLKRQDDQNRVIPDSTQNTDQEDLFSNSSSALLSELFPVQVENYGLEMGLNGVNPSSNYEI